MATTEHRAKYYDRTKRVSQGTIDKINKMGMEKALAHARSGQADDEFFEGAKRFYGSRVHDSESSAPSYGSQRGTRGEGGSPTKSSDNTANTNPSHATNNNGGSGGGGNTQVRNAPAPAKDKPESTGTSAYNYNPPDKSEKDKPKSNPTKAAIERKIADFSRPGGHDINRSEYADRLKELEGLSASDRLSGLSKLRKQAQTDREKREGWTKEKETAIGAKRQADEKAASDAKFNPTVSRPGGHDLNREEYKDNVAAIEKKYAGNPAELEKRLKALAKGAKKDRENRERGRSYVEAAEQRRESQAQSRR